MTTVGSISDVIKMAVSQIGTAESPPHSNNVKYNTWYYGHAVSGKDYAWCMAFCQWVYDQCNVRLPYKTASCSRLADEARKVGMFRETNVKPGDLALLRFTRFGPPKHCGIVETVKGDKLTIIEGNTSLSNDTNGGSVMRRNRTISGNIYGVVRPIFGAEAKGVEDMTVNEFINELTDEQAYKLWQKAIAHAEKQPLPSWVKGDDKAAWERANSKKVITGKPEAPVKRDELAFILGRIGQL